MLTEYPSLSSLVMTFVGRKLERVAVPREMDAAILDDRFSGKVIECRGSHATECLRRDADNVFS